VAALRKKYRERIYRQYFFSQSDKADIRELIDSEATKEGKNFCSISLITLTFTLNPNL